MNFFLAPIPTPTTSIRESSGLNASGSPVDGQGVLLDDNVDASQGVALSFQQILQAQGVSGDLPQNQGQWTAFSEPNSVLAEQALFGVQKNTAGDLLVGVKITNDQEFISSEEATNLGTLNGVAQSGALLIPGMLSASKNGEFTEGEVAGLFPLAPLTSVDSAIESALQSDDNLAVTPFNLTQKIDAKVVLDTTGLPDTGRSPASPFFTLPSASVSSQVGAEQQKLFADVKNLSPQRLELGESKNAMAIDVSQGITKQATTLTQGLNFQNFSAINLKQTTLSDSLSAELSSLEKAEAMSSQLNASLQTFSTKNTAANARMQMPVNLQFGHADWANQVAERSALMSAQKIQFAELQLDPPELGQLQVRVSVNQDQQASVSFSSPHASVREALDQSVVRLRELLEEQGVDLVDVNVSDHPHAEEDEAHSKGFASDTENTEADDADQADVESISVQSHYGVDYYA